MFRAVVTNAFGSATSNAATLTVTTNSRPPATITAPAAGSLTAAATTINYAGTGDRSRGRHAARPAPSPGAVDFHHDTHIHPFMPDTTGITSGSFTIPTPGETATNVWYRIHLTVRDSGGLTQHDLPRRQPAHRRPSRSRPTRPACR